MSFYCGCKVEKPWEERETHELGGRVRRYLVHSAECVRRTARLDVTLEYKDFFAVFGIECSAC